MSNAHTADRYWYHMCTHIELKMYAYTNTLADKSRMNSLDTKNKIEEFNSIVLYSKRRLQVSQQIKFS
jgi:hypothetical protein